MISSSSFYFYFYSSFVITQNIHKDFFTSRKFSSLNFFCSYHIKRWKSLLTCQIVVKNFFLSLCHNWTHTRFSQVTVKNLKSRHITMAFENWMNERNGKFVSMLNFSPPQLSMHKSGCYCCFTQRTCADMLTHVRQIWNIIVMLLSSIFTDTENRKRPLLIRWCSLRSLSFSLQGFQREKWKKKKYILWTRLWIFLRLWVFIAFHFLWFLILIWSQMRWRLRRVPIVEDRDLPP